MESSDTSFSSSSLLCDEDDSSLLTGDDVEMIGPGSMNRGLVLEDEDQYIEALFEREMEFALESRDFSSTARIWLKSARLDAIDWMFSTRAKFGLKLHTVYLSVTYFDRFLSKRSIDPRELGSVQILSVGCLSLAAKMEEQKTPSLSQYSVEQYHFENNKIKDMELMILSDLEWKMGSVTPFAYLHYFVNKFCGESRQEVIVPRAMEHIIAIVKDINLVEHRPSIIASAAILAAFDDTLTRNSIDLHISVISSYGPPESERVFSFYKLMQGKGGRKSRTPASDLLATHSSSAGVLGNSSRTASGAKRQLSFGESEDCPVQKTHRP